jgi:hypothetical protein
MGMDPWERLSEDHVPAKGEVEQDRRCGEADGGAGAVEAEDPAEQQEAGEERRGGEGRELVPLGLGLGSQVLQAT